MTVEFYGVIVGNKIGPLRISFSTNYMDMVRDVAKWAIDKKLVKLRYRKWWKAVINEMTKYDLK